MRSGSDGFTQRSRDLAVFALLGFVVPIGAYFWLIGRYGVDTIFSDQWWDIHLIGLSYSGHLNVSALWAQHNENRILFPNLIVLLLAYTTHLNTRIEMYVSAVIFIAAIALFALAHKRRASARHWIYYCPVAILLLSLVQFGDTLWGFQVAWYLVMLTLAVALFLLDRPALTGFTLAAAMGAGIIGSYSSIQGLLIWPAGLVLLYHRRRPWPQVLAWMAVAAATAIVYFSNFNVNSGSPYHKYAIQHPLASIKFIFFALGDVTGVRVAYGSSNVGIELLGAFIFCLAIAAVITCGLRRDDTGGSPVGVALIVFGILFAVLITEGRVIWGDSTAGAGASRYTTFDLLVPVGIYLTLLGSSAQSVRTRSLRTAKWKGTALPVLWALTLLAICVQVPFGLANGISGSSSSRQTQVLAADVTVNAARATDGLLTTALGSTQRASRLRSWVHIARTHDLSLFATAAVGAYTREGLLPAAQRLAPSSQTPTPVPEFATKVLRPFNGATVSGTTILDASAAGATRVEFRISGGSDGFSGPVLCTATSTPYGWSCRWRSTTVPNGSYVLLSEGFDGVRRTYSTTVRIIVNNTA